MEGHVIIEGQRRRVWPDELKRQIVEESYDRDTTVLEVGRRYEVDPAQIYAWRKKFAAEVPGATAPFLPVETGTATTASDPEQEVQPTSPERIEVSFPDGCRLSLSAETPVACVPTEIAAPEPPTSPVRSSTFDAPY